MEQWKEGVHPEHPLQRATGVGPHVETSLMKEARPPPVLCEQGGVLNALYEKHF